MTDFYRIGVKITMADGVSAVLATLGQEFLGLDKRVNVTQDNIGRLRSAIIGMGELTVGGALLHSFGALAVAGGKVVDELAKMRAMGIDAATAAQNMADAYKLAASVMGATPAGAARMISELRSILENSGQARTAAPMALQFAAVLRSLNPGMSETAADSAVMAWLKGLDIQGAFVNRKTGQLDPQKANQAFEMMEAAALLTQGLLTGQGFYQFTRMAGPAASLEQLRDYLTQTVEVMLGLGRTGGRGMQMAAKTLLGGNLTKAQAEELTALGAVAPGGIKETAGHYALQPGALVGYADLATKGVGYWFQHDMLPLLKKAEDGKGMAGLMAALTKSGGMDKQTANLVALMSQLGAFPATEQRLFSFLLMNQAQVQKFKAQFEKATKGNPGQVLSDQSWTMNFQNLETAWTGLLEALGTPAAQMAVPIIRDLADAMKSMTGWIGGHPDAAKALVGVMGTLGSVLTVAGGLRLGAVALSVVGRALPALAGGLGAFGSGTEAAGAIGLLSTGLPELAVALVGFAQVLPLIEQPLAAWVDRNIWGMNDKQAAAYQQRQKEMARKGEQEFIGFLEHMLGVRGGKIFNWGLPQNWNIGNAPDGGRGWRYDPKAASPPPAPVHVTINAPLTVEGSLIGTAAELNELLNNWWGMNSVKITSAIRQVIAAGQTQGRRSTMQDPGNAETVNLGGFAMGGL